MKRFVLWLGENIIVWPFFIFLSACLFLGDGKQTIIDVLGAGFVLTLFVISKFFLPKQREFPTHSATAWVALTGYFLLRTVFSNDVGYSVFATLRYVEAALLYYMFFVYSTEKIEKTISHALVLFCVFALVCSLVVVYVPGHFVTLPLMNLLAATYGHNHVVDVLLLGYAVSLFLWIKTKKNWHGVCVFVFVLGTMVSFARAALLIEAITVVIIIVRNIFQKKKVNPPLIILSVFVLAAAFVFLSIPYQQLKSVKPFSQYTKQNNFLDPRLELIRQSLRSIEKNPVFGTGPGTFLLVSKQNQNGPAKHSWFAHNYALELLTETGFVGLFLVLFVIVNPFLKSIKKQKTTALLFGAGILFLYSFFDYPLSYLVVWFLFWALLGVGGRIVDKNTNNFIKTTPTMVFVAVSLLTLGYLLLLSSFFLNTFPSRIILVSKAGEMARNGSSLNRFILFLHKKNPDILYDLLYTSKNGDQHKNENMLFLAATLDPQNPTYYLEIFRHLIDNKEYNLLWEKLQNLSCTTYKGSLCKKIQSISLPSGKEALLNTIFSSEIYDVRNDYSAIYYYIGYNFLSTDPPLTKAMWELATLARSDNGHYFIERASLERYIFSNEKEVKRLLLECQKRPEPREECVYYAGKNLPEPGWYFESIRRYQ